MKVREGMSVAGAALTLLIAVAAAGAQGSRDAAPGEGTIAARLGEVPAGERARWEDYLANSRQLAARDRQVMAAELASIGATRMRRAQYASAAFDGGEGRPAAWFTTAEARRLADNLLTYQTPSGGWSKRVAYDSARAPGQSWYSESDGWSYIPTIDNGATTSQLWYLGRIDAAQPDARYRAAFLRGLDYLLTAQYPTGCWPQVFPLQGSYHDAATFNDDAATNVLTLLDAVTAVQFPFVGEEMVLRAARASALGLECLLKSQVGVGGRRTVWGQQHDPITLQPVGARSYELRSLSGRESAGIMTYLMSLRAPDARVAAAIHAAAAYFNATAVRGVRYDYQQGATADPGAGPIWARMTEIGTNRPIFANRDGVVLYDWNQLTDRRTGYAWYGTEPGSALKKYEKWRRAHPELVPVEK